MGVSERPNMDDWAHRLSQEQMPAFAATAKAVGMKSRDRDASFSELAKLVLQDAGMTSRALRRANSIYHRPGRGEIKTISRAVVVLGLESLSSLCVSNSLVDAMAQGAKEEAVSQELARSFHAAAQARGFAAETRDPEPEEVFIATLLHRLGHIAFWSFGGRMREAVRAMMGKGMDRDQAERQVLGFGLDDLTARLSRDWKLSPLLEDALSGKDDPRTRTVLLCQKLARVAELGWATPEVRETLADLADHLGLARDKVEELVHAHAAEAVRTTASLGAIRASQMIPLDKRDQELVAAEPEAVVAPTSGAMLRLELFSDLTTMIAEGRTDLSQLVGLTLEGLYRGIGMDRVVFAMLTANRQALLVRHALGLHTPPVGSRFCALSKTDPNLFTYCLAKQRELWVEPEALAELTSLMTRDVREASRGGAFFVMPAIIAGRAIGLFYADRRNSGGALTQDDFTGFRQFCQQANLGLSLAAGSRRR